MPRILLLRLSSMGDVIHTLPAVTDLANAVPGCTIDWVVEEGFAELPRLHPAIADVVPVALRRWRKTLFAVDTRAEFGTFRRHLRANEYDLVLDVQGLMKSAMIGHLARGPLAGYDGYSSREPLASLLYRDRYAVSRDQHAVQRNRQLMAAAVGYSLDGPVDYGLLPPSGSLPWLSGQPYVVLLTATSRADKEWPDADWITLGRRFAAAGLTCVLPWGNPVECKRAERLAVAIERAIVAPKLTLTEAAALLAGSRIVVGVDTGLTHLAAAVAVPVVALFRASDPIKTGVLANSYSINLGHAGATPHVETVWDAVQVGIRP